MAVPPQVPREYNFAADRAADEAASMVNDMTTEQRTPWSVQEIKAEDFLIWQTVTNDAASPSEHHRVSSRKVIRTCTRAIAGEPGFTLRLPSVA